MHIITRGDNSLGQFMSLLSFKAVVLKRGQSSPLPASRGLWDYLEAFSLVQLREQVLSVPSG